MLKFLSGDRKIRTMYDSIPQLFLVKRLSVVSYVYRSLGQSIMAASNFNMGGFQSRLIKNGGTAKA